MEDKKFVVALISFFDNEIKQFIIEAPSEYEAFKKAMLEFVTDEDSKRAELEWQNSPLYPPTYQGILDTIPNWEMDCSIIEIKCNECR